MNTFYYFENNIYETVEQVENATKNYVNPKYDIIETDKSFEEFEKAYEDCRADGNSCQDSIEWAK